jgi:hypothetical protein
MDKAMMVTELDAVESNVMVMVIVMVKEVVVLMTVVEVEAGPLVVIDIQVLVKLWPVSRFNIKRRLEQYMST